MLAGRLLGIMNDIELSRTEESKYTPVTVNVVDTPICRNCDQVRSEENQSSDRV